MDERMCNPRFRTRWFASIAAGRMRVMAEGHGAIESGGMAWENRGKL
jgi:hypothetical protein